MNTRVIQIMLKRHANEVTGGLTQTSKMPCKSYSLPTIACKTGARLAQVKGSICSLCYAQKGFYALYAKTIEPAQVARLFAIDDPDWTRAMAASIGNDPYFRWHDSGDLQSLSHLEKIADVCHATLKTRHWLPTREYAIVKRYVEKHGALPINLTVRLSAMFPDQPVVVPASLRNVRGIAVSNVHTVKPIGGDCNASKQDGECRSCRKCWSADVTVSYKLH